MRHVLTAFCATFLAACASGPTETRTPNSGQTSIAGALPDRVAYLQTDPRWARDELGRSGDTLGSDGCLVTAVAMAMTNLGLTIDPGQLNRELTRANAFTPQGWLVWSGVDVVSDGQAKAVYYDTVSPGNIRMCLREGQYPLVRFFLPNGRSHWAMIIAESPEGYRMRDPLRSSRKPLIFPRGAEAFKALRCVGPGPDHPRRV